ncbi:MAG: asparagine synthase-related protein [Rhodospirillaceae bacterium]
MTGIAGWTGFPPGAADTPAAEAVLDRMMSAGTRHPGAVRKLASDGFRSVGVEGWPERCDVCLVGGVFAAIYGEPVWSDPALRARARDQGHAAALVAAWRDRGRDLFEALHGPVSIAVGEAATRRALIAIDRLGIQQMCYAPAGDGGLVFASDARAVAAHPSVERVLSRQAIFNYLYFYVSPGPPTVFGGVRKLLAGQYASLDGGRIETGFYWQPPFSEPEDADAGALARDVLAVLDASVERAAGDTAATGAFLSGGLDSTTVAGLLAKHRPGAKCFTIAFPEERYNELPWAEAGARHFGIDHVTHVLTPAETISAIPGLVEAHDEPHGNSSSVPAFVCARVARDSGIDVLLAGDGGDEIFAGNERYVEQARYDGWRRLPRPLRDRVVLPLLRGLAPSAGSGLPARLRAYAERAAMPLPERLQAYNLLETEDLRTVFEPEFLAALDPEEPRRLQRESFGRIGSATDLKRMHMLDLQITLADNDLRKVNRSCEMAGVRVRYPMLDEDLVALAARIPSRLLLRDGRLRGFYKDAMADFLPPGILTKEKHGFGMPFAEWTRAPGDLRDMAVAAIGDFAERGILRARLLGEIRAELTAEGNDGGNSGGFGGMVWDIMMLEHWLARNGAGATLR